jgi:hypothetical protein
MNYIRIIHNGSGVQEIEITEHQMRCDKLGLPDETPEGVVNERWKKYLNEADEHDQRTENRRNAAKAARERLAQFNENAIANMDERAARAVLARLIIDIRDILSIEEMEDEHNV